MLLIPLSFLVLVSVSSKELRAQATGSSRKLLQLTRKLGDLLQRHKEVYVSLLWQYVNCPAWGILWVETVARGETNLKESRAYLEVTEEDLPAFLDKLGSRNHLVVELGSISGRVLQHGR